MKTNHFVKASIISLSLLTVACVPKTQLVNTNGIDQTPTTMGLDYRDFEKAASEAVVDLVHSGAIDHPQGGRYVLAISRITNDTMQRIDTDQLVKKIRVELLKSGKVVTTTAIGLNGPEDPMVAKSRQLRASEEVNQKTVAAKNQIVAPDFSLSGKIMQRNHRIDRNTQQVEYYVQLSLTNLTNGLAYWEGETPIIKRGSNKSASW